VARSPGPPEGSCGITIPAPSAGTPPILPRILCGGVGFSDLGVESPGSCSLWSHLQPHESLRRQPPTPTTDTNRPSTNHQPTHTTEPTQPTPLTNTSHDRTAPGALLQFEFEQLRVHGAGPVLWQLSLLGWLVGWLIGWLVGEGWLVVQRGGLAQRRGAATGLRWVRWVVHSACCWCGCCCSVSIKPTQPAR